MLLFAIMATFANLSSVERCKILESSITITITALTFSPHPVYSGLLWVQGESLYLNIIEFGIQYKVHIVLISWCTVLFKIFLFFFFFKIFLMKSCIEKKNPFGKAVTFLLHWFYILGINSWKFYTLMGWVRLDIPGGHWAFG